MTIDPANQAAVSLNRMPTAIPTNDFQEQPVRFSEVRTILWSKRKLLATAACVGAILGLVIAFAIRPYYTASASFVPPPSSQNASSLIASQLSSIGASGLLGGASKNSGDLYVAILHSHAVSAELIKRFSLLNVYEVKKESQAEKLLEKHTQITIDAKSSIVTVQVTDHDAERAKKMANAFLEAAREKSGQLALTESSQRRLFYEDRLAKEKESLSNAEVALKETEENSGLISPIGQTASELQGIAQLRAQITEREVRMAGLLHDETSDNPDVLRLKSEIENLRAQLQQRENGNARGQLSTAKVPALALEYVRRQRDVKYHETLFEILAKQYEAARMDEAHDQPLQVLDYADTPDTKAGPPRALIAIAGTLLGFLSAAGWIIWENARLRTRAAASSS